MTTPLLHATTRPTASAPLTPAHNVRLDLAVGSPRLFAAGHQADAAAHLATFGTVPALNPQQVLEHIFESNLDGRGGASFSTYCKLITTDQGPKTTIIANGAEGEYLSHKDRTLLLHAPHLVLDGLQIAGELIGTRNLALYAREESLATIALLAAARGITCYTAPGTFISGEASAAVNAITTGTPLPMDHTRRLAKSEKAPGLFGKTRHATLVHNVETLAHLALIARYGASYFASTGAIGTRILTLHHRGTDNVTVIEVPDHTPLTQALALAEIDQPTPAVLLGGFQGRWIPADQLTTPIGSKDAPAAAGIIYPLTPAECPIDTTAAIASYLADQSARQCGPCTNGLPALANTLTHLTSTTAPFAPTEQTRTTLNQLAHLLPGRGICKHPDATVRFITNTLTTYHHEITAHTHGTCTAHS